MKKMTIIQKMIMDPTAMVIAMVAMVMVVKKMMKIRKILKQFTSITISETRDSKILISTL
jgi:hypothetical protein